MPSRPSRKKVIPKTEEELMREAEIAVIAAAVADVKSRKKKRVYRPRSTTAPARKPKEPRPRPPPKPKAERKPRPSQVNKKRREQLNRAAAYQAHVAQLAAEREAAENLSYLANIVNQTTTSPPNTEDADAAVYERHLFNIFNDYSALELEGIITQVEIQHQVCITEHSEACAVADPAEQVQFHFDHLPAIPSPAVAVRTADIATVNLNSAIFAGHVKVVEAGEELAELLDDDPFKYIDADYLLSLDKILFALVPEETFVLDPKIVLREHDYARPPPS